VDAAQHLSRSDGPPGLPARFTALLRRLGSASEPGALYAALAAAWTEPHRAYHGISHLADCLRELDEAPQESEARDPAEAALWFHDAVYDPRAADNERRSAAWARRALSEAGVPDDVATEVSRLVLLTRHGDPPEPPDPTGALVCDVDLSILGRSPEEYDRFERLIRAEYAWVPAPIYRAERARVLARLRRRDPLYLTRYFRRRYQTAAHSNLDRTLEVLASQ
jgi:predicted metal-dependent HD superfamily phosphohydrolase